MNLPVTNWWYKNILGGNLEATFLILDHLQWSKKISLTPKCLLLDLEGGAPVYRICASYYCIHAFNESKSWNVMKQIVT